MNNPYKRKFFALGALVLSIAISASSYATDSTSSQIPPTIPVFVPWQVTATATPEMGNGNPDCAGNSFHYTGYLPARGGPKYYFPIDTQVVIKITGYYSIITQAYLCNAGTGDNMGQITIYKNASWAHGDAAYQPAGGDVPFGPWPLATSTWTTCGQECQTLAATSIAQYKLYAGEVVGFALTTAYSADDAYFQGGFIRVKLLDPLDYP